MKKLCLVLIIFMSISACQQATKDDDPISALEKKDTDPRKKVVLIMIDSMTGSIVDRTIEKGSTPALSYLIEKGQYYKDLVAPFPSMSVVIESSLITGEMPDKHRIPGLNWYDLEEDRLVDYGTSLGKTIKLGVRRSLEDSIFHLNNAHLNKESKTIFEELQQRGFTTGAINFIMYRGETSHPVTIPFIFQKLFQMPNGMHTKGPDFLAFGQLVKPDLIKETSLSDSMFNRYGLNDKYSAAATRTLIKKNAQPDFLAVFLPEFDRAVHKHSIEYIKGFEQSELYLQEILNSYESWDQALEENIFIIVEDHGQDKLSDEKEELIIDLNEIYHDLTVAPIGEGAKLYDVAIANNHRSVYVYAPNHAYTLRELSNLALIDQRIALTSWLENGWVHVQSPDFQTIFRFKKGNGYVDRYGQGWEIEGDERIVSIKKEGNKIKYKEYPDVLNQLYSSLNSQDASTLVLAAKPSYQFYSEGAAIHKGGGEHGGIHANDTLTALVITGTDQKPKNLRMTDLKEYILNLFNE